MDASKQRKKTVGAAASRLSDARKAHGETQEEIANALGISKATVRSFERQPDRAPVWFVKFYAERYGQDIRHLTECSGEFTQDTYGLTKESIEVLKNLREDQACNRALNDLLRADSFRALLLQLDIARKRVQLLQAALGVQGSDEENDLQLFNNAELSLFQLSRTVQEICNELYGVDLATRIYKQRVLTDIPKERRKRQRLPK